MVFNKLLLKEIPLPATVLFIQMAFAVVAMLCCFRTLHFGSMRDVLRWTIVAPFFTGVLLSSMLALKGCSMTLIIVARSLSPVVATVIERFYPTPPHVSWKTIACLAAAVAFSVVYGLQ